MHLHLAMLSVLDLQPRVYGMELFAFGIPAGVDTQSRVPQYLSARKEAGTLWPLTPGRELSSGYSPPHGISQHRCKSSASLCPPQEKGFINVGLSPTAFT